MLRILYILISLILPDFLMNFPNLTSLTILTFPQRKIKEVNFNSLLVIKYYTKNEDLRNCTRNSTEPCRK